MMTLGVIMLGMVIMVTIGALSVRAENRAKQKSLSESSGTPSAR